jgi:hypothetical protein
VKCFLIDKYAKKQSAYDMSIFNGSSVSGKLYVASKFVSLLLGIVQYNKIDALFGWEKCSLLFLFQEGFGLGLLILFYSLRG